MCKGGGGGGNPLCNPSFAQFQKGLPPRCEIAHLAVCVLAVFLLVLCAVFRLWNVQIVGTLLAPLVAGASRPLGSLREPYCVPYNR